MADNTNDPTTPKSKINLDDFTRIRKVPIPEHMQSLSQSSVNEDMEHVASTINFDSDDSHPFQEEPSLSLSDLDGSKDLEELNFIDDEDEIKPMKHTSKNAIDNLDAYGYETKTQQTLSLLEFESLEKQLVNDDVGVNERQTPPQDKDLAHYLREQGVMYEDDFEDSSSKDLKDQGVIGDSDDEGTIKGDDFDELNDGIMAEAIMEEDEFDEFGVMKEPGQRRSYDSVSAPTASPVDESLDMMKFLQKTPKEHFEHKPLSLSQDTYSSDVFEVEEQHDQTVTHNSSQDLSSIIESSPEHKRHDVSESDESAKESGPEEDIKNTSADSMNASTLSKQNFPDISSLTDITREELVSPDDIGNNSDLNNTSETVINLSDVIDTSPERYTKHSVSPTAIVTGKPPKSIGPPIKKSTPKGKDSGVENGRSSPQKSGRVTPNKTGRSTPKSGRTTPKSGRTTPVSGRTTPLKSSQSKADSGKTTPSKTSKDVPSKSGRNTPSKNGRDTPTSKSGRTTPSAKVSGRTTPSRIPVRRGSTSGRSTPSKYKSDDESGETSRRSGLSSTQYTSESPPSSQIDNYWESSVCSTDWENLSDTSRRELTARLKREASSRIQADELVDQLQSDYDDLLQKYALAEVTIDQLRLGARITVESTPPQPGQSTTGTLSKALQPQTINLGSLSHARLSPAPQHAILSDTMRGDPINTSHTTITTADDIDDDDPVLAAVTSAESTAMGLRFQAKTLKEQMESFQKILSEDQLSPEDQKEVFERIKVQHERLEREYLHAKEEQNTIQRQTNLITDKHDKTFDAEKEIEGEIFQLGMQLEDLNEKVQDNCRSTTANDTIGSTDAMLASLDPELGRRKQQLTQEYHTLLNRCRQLKQLDSSFDRDRELDDLVEHLRNLHNENPDLFGHELPPEIRDREGGSSVLPDRFFSASNPNIYIDHLPEPELYAPLSEPSLFSTNHDPIRYSNYQSSDSLQESPDSSPEIRRRTSYGSSRIPTWSGRGTPNSSPEMIPKSQYSGRSTPNLSKQQSSLDYNRNQKYSAQRNPLEGDIDSGFVGSEGSRHSNQTSISGYGRKDRSGYSYSTIIPSQTPSLYSRQSPASVRESHRASVTSQSHKWTESEDDMSYTTGNGRSVQSYDTVEKSSRRGSSKQRKSPASISSVVTDASRPRRPTSGRSRDSIASSRVAPSYYSTEEEDKASRQGALTQRILRDKEVERWADPVQKRDKFDSASVVSRSSVKSEAIRALHDEVQKLKRDMVRARHPPLQEELKAQSYEMPNYEKPTVERERSFTTPNGSTRSLYEKERPSRHNQRQGSSPPREAYQRRSSSSSRCSVEIGHHMRDEGVLRVLIEQSHHYSNRVYQPPRDQDYPAREYPAREYPAREYPAREYPTREYPSGEFLPRDYSSREYLDENQEYDRSFRATSPYMESGYLDDRPRYAAYDSPYIDAYVGRPVSPIGRPLSPHHRSMSMPSFNIQRSPCPLCGGTGSHTHGQYAYPEDYGRESPPQATYAPPPPNYAQAPTMARHSPIDPAQPVYAPTSGSRMAQSVPSIPTAVSAGYQQPQMQQPVLAPTSPAQHVVTQPTYTSVQSVPATAQQQPIQIISKTPVRQYTTSMKKGKVRYYEAFDTDTATEEEIIYRRTSPRRESRRPHSRTYQEDRASKVESIRLGISLEDAIRTAEKLKRRSRKMLTGVRNDVLRTEMSESYL
uniref:Serine/arginine repetitive matrix protein 2-like n=1 Tax=Saccoglossus kowalevskii TaxID=10224 RepID=A0ABM0MSQ3_SACKO|nr:PREDICTED: serine/arginine repetitive matrix protein 2-like [Saccoglossus kowalevskii]